MVITDGRSLDDVHTVSKQIRARGVTIYSVGVGRYFNARELDSMATDPDKTHVFTSDFKQLQYITNDLKKAICMSKHSIRTPMTTVANNCNIFLMQSFYKPVDEKQLPFL